MQKLKNDSFFINWVLRDEIAIGPAPTKEEHLNRLENHAIKGILSLCSIEEAKPPNDMIKTFRCERIVLPDHSYDRKMNFKEITIVLQKLEELKKFGPIFIHCKAGVERSPLICMAWLVKYKSLTIQQSLDYLMRINKGTCPSTDQLYLLKNLN
mgnify:CR=1 FL=1